ERAAYLTATTLPERDWGGPGVDPAHVVGVLQRVLARDAIVTTDAGNFGLWPARYFKFGRAQTFLGPTSGAMGSGLPAAFGASASVPIRSSSPPLPPRSRRVRPRFSTSTWTRAGSARIGRLDGILNGTYTSCVTLNVNQPLSSDAKREELIGDVLSEMNQISF